MKGPNPSALQLQKSILRLQAVIDSNRAEVISVVRQILQSYNISPGEIIARDEKPSSRRVAVAKRSKASKGTGALLGTKGGRPTGTRQVAAKYRDTSGNTWSGRGKTPTWLKKALEGGATLESLRIS